MSKLDELLNRAPFADDGMSASFYTREEIDAARAELAALRRRAEDAEMMNEHRIGACARDIFHSTPGEPETAFDAHDRIAKILRKYLGNAVAIGFAFGAALQAFAWWWI